MKILFTILLSFLSTIAYCQNSDSLTLGKGNNDFFVKGNQKYRLSEYKKVFTNAEALQYMKKARTNSTVSQVFGGIGGAFMGFGLGRAISGGNKTVTQNGMVIKEKAKGTWGFIGAGLGIVGIGIPFALSSNKNLKKAVNAQNKSSENVETKATSYRFEIGGNGIALSYNF